MPKKSVSIEAKSEDSGSSERDLKQQSDAVATKPKVRKMREAVPVLEAIDQSLPANARPLVGFDLQRFHAQHGLQTADAIYALGIQNHVVFGRLIRGGQLPYGIELLIRLYDRHPGPAPWGAMTPTEGFSMLYGDILRDFEVFQGGIHRDSAYKALCDRMTAAFGRSNFTSYRWFGVNGDGNAKVQVSRILGKLSAIPNPRDELEGIAKLMYRVRGVDLDDQAPLPTRENPPKLKRRRGVRKKKKTNIASA